MQIKSFAFQYHIFDSIDELPETEQHLIGAALDASRHLSYAPYSHFAVGAALLLASGEVVKGSNQENASFPAGICAERVALGVAATLYPGRDIEAIAITYQSASHQPSMPLKPLSPCGICRQVLLEAASRQQLPLKIIMAAEGGRTGFVVDDIRRLLPFGFGADML